MLDAVDEKDFEAAMEVFLNDADMAVEGEDWNDREGIYFERICKRYKVLRQCFIQMA